MEKVVNEYFGTKFERLFVGFLSLINGFLVAYLSVMGPLLLNNIQYKTHPLVDNQLLGQDIINLVLMSPLLFIAGFLILIKNRLGKYFLIVTPLYLIYYAISYAVGWEWMAPGYSGNSEKFFFHFIFILISSMIFILYSINTFPRQVKAKFHKPELGIYSTIYGVFLVLFAWMWIREIIQLYLTGTTRSYSIAPTSFWLVRTFDLGFVIPLGFMSIYLLWVRPEKAYSVQFLFYGFFVTQVTTVLAMSLMMLVKKDPAFDWTGTVIFAALAIIVYTGFAYVIRGYNQKAR
jgi:hypothetical protein